MSSSSTANFPTTLPKSFPTVIDDNSKKDPEESVDFTGDFKTKFSPENLTRLAGALGDLFGQGEGGEIYKELTKRMEESKEELLEMTEA
jgi:hypothetical protein